MSVNENRKHLETFLSLILVLALALVGLAQNPPNRPIDPVNYPPSDPLVSRTDAVTGKHFESGSVVVDTDQEVTSLLEATAGEVSLLIEPSSGSTSFMLRGLVPSSTYHMYIDDYHNHELIDVEPSGSYAFTLDTPDSHFVSIQLKPSTLFISDSVTGGDCISVGIWNAATRTCTLTTDVTGTIQIDSAAVSLDCEGRSIVGFGSGNGIFIPVNAATVTNCDISGFARGILALSSNSHVITENNVHDISLQGILLFFSDSNTIRLNAINDTLRGVSFFNSSSNTVTDNTIADARIGIFLRQASDNNTIDSNTINGSVRRGITLAGSGPFPTGPFRGPSFNEITRNEIDIFNERHIIGIFLNFGSNENQLLSNQINVERIGSMGGSAIAFDVAANSNVVISNMILATRVNGISMESGSGVGNDDNIFRDNSITGAINPFVILLSERNIVDSNNVQNSGASRLWGGSNNVFRANVIQNGINAGNQLCFVGDVCQVVGEIECNLDMGIHISGETGSVVTENTVRNTVGEGIVVSDLVREKLDTSPANLEACYGPPFESPAASGVLESLEAIDIEISHNVVRENSLDGIKLVNAPDNRIFLNDIFDNLGFPVSSNTAALFIDDLGGPPVGNYWGRNCPLGPFFLPGVDSNLPSVLDRSPFGIPVANLDPSLTPNQPCPSGN